MNIMTAPVVDTPQSNQGRAWWFLNTLVVEHLMASGAGPVVLEQTLSLGAAPPRHVHHDLDDSWYLLEGQMVVQCGIGEPAGARELPAPTGGPGFEALSRAILEHDATVVGDSLSEEQAQTFLAEIGRQAARAPGDRL